MNHVHTEIVFVVETVLAGQVKKSAVIDVRNMAPEGMFALESTITGSGTIKWTYECCTTKGGVFLEPEDAVDIYTAQTVGQIYQAFQPELTPFIKIVATETGGVNPVVIASANLAIQ